MEVFNISFRTEIRKFLLHWIRINSDCGFILSEFLNSEDELLTLLKFPALLLKLLSCGWLGKFPSQTSSDLCSDKALSNLMRADSLSSLVRNTGTLAFAVKLFLKALDTEHSI